jgi:hypothetical protein
VEVIKSGKYRFELMRWPKEADKAIREGFPASAMPIPGGQPFGEGIALDIVRARLKIQDYDETIDVSETMKSADFVLDLEIGKTKLQTWFTLNDSLSLGAYYVYVSKLD